MFLKILVNKKKKSAQREVEHFCPNDPYDGISNETAGESSRAGASIVK